MAHVRGLVIQKLLLQNEYLIAENRILRTHSLARMYLSDPERSTFAEIGELLGRTSLQKVACVAKPETILAWYRRLITPLSHNIVCWPHERWIAAHSCRE